MEINERIEQMIKENSKDRIFPILNNLDRYWSNNPHLTLCNVVKALGLDDNLDDLQVTKTLDKHIDDNNIK